MNTNDNNTDSELVVGSRLISADVLRDPDALETALRGVAPSDMGGLDLNFYLLGRKGIVDAVPRGGSDAVNLAWRRALVHEADPYELNWQPAFWGSNDERLLEIKRRVDSGNFF
jgi:hypothetical protein